MKLLLFYSSHKESEVMSCSMGLRNFRRGGFFGYFIGVCPPRL
jgi:hypothetical protein